MRIVVDAMGGDFAPGEIVSGTVEAALEQPLIKRLYLVGDRSAIEQELAQHRSIPDTISIHHASEVVEMGEAPAVAIRRKKDSSISQAIELLKSGKAEALFSAGNTGAVVAGSTLKLRVLEGVERPAIAAIIPTPAHPFILIDVGANPDCSPRMLAQFAVMGYVYSSEILHVRDPKIGLLSIGGEDVKGNEVTKEAFQLLDDSAFNFQGNVEARDLFEGRVDVGVCDGFVGNVVLKMTESVARAIGQWTKDEFMKNPFHMLAGLLSAPVIRKIKKRSDPETYGGAPLLGVNGVCIIGHGSSSARAVRNAINVAAESISHQVNDLIEEHLKTLNHRSD